ncbi:MAG TPA: type IV pilus twitching motility protein PilT [Negativicutes bacterium]|nr:type IV pilus twitching motility protein PilT [Negativicutes bacterium]
MIIDDLLREAVLRRASDLHLTVEAAPTIRVNGTLIRLDLPVLNAEDTRQLFESIATADRRQQLQQTGEVDFSHAICGIGRFRINAFRQRGATAIAIRVIAEKTPTLDQLGLPDIIKTFSRKPRGLVLVTGPTGSGKSTTMAAMIDLINEERRCNIITLEDPIEYLHRHKNSLVNQREIGADTQSFANALRAALREDPDVILVGEMRDMDTISIAVRAAETGHLVLATLHTGDAAQTIDRILDFFPPHQQQQIRVQLSLSLQGIVAQQLLPRQDGSGRVAAVEVLVATPAVRNLIREGKSHQLLSVIQTGAKSGMQSMDAALRDLCCAGIVADEEAMERVMDLENFLRLRRG